MTEESPDVPPYLHSRRQSRSVCPRNKVTMTIRGLLRNETRLFRMAYTNLVVETVR